MSFHHHDLVGAKLAKKRLRALRFDNDTIASVARLIELHLRFFGYTEGGWTDSAVRRYVRDAGDQLERLHMLTRADVTTRNRRKADRLGFAYDDLEARIADLRAREEIDSLRPDLDGDDIQRVLGIGPSREVGEAYRFLLELRTEEGPLGAEAATERLHILTRADVTTRNRRKAARLASAYDDIERRIGELAEQEALDALRPALGGTEIMEILGIEPGRAVGEAYRFLLDIRLDEGEVSAEEAERRLLEWWAARV